MRLEIILHEKVLQLTGGAVDDANCFYAHVIAPEFEHNISELQKNSYYVSEKRHRTFGYPYSLHTELRRNLSVVIGDDPENWKNATPETPFYQLFNFADNQGCIDWKSSAELLQDFEKYKDKVATLATEDYFRKIYFYWLDLLKVASIEGNVIEFS